MRAGGTSVQQTLTPEAAAAVRHAVALARRRGHAQATPLHVAATLLSLRSSPLRRACLKSQQQNHPLPLSNAHHSLPHSHPSLVTSLSTSLSHPLQCRALELCFNVALNRLPTSATPLSNPSLSNALVAALKRAQAHQRRGTIEQQPQPPLLTVKVELEQLVISILDDPSVSRVMREAGFSSTTVKNNLEDTVSSGFSPPYSSPNHSLWNTQLVNYSLDQNPPFVSPEKAGFWSDSREREEDMRVVMEVLVRKKRRNTVVIGDCSESAEGIVREVIVKAERGEVPEGLRSVKFVQLQFVSLSSFRVMKRENVDLEISSVRKRVDGCLGSGSCESVIVYTGDLKWVAEGHERVGSFLERESGYSPVDHVVSELGRLVLDLNYQGKVWLMGSASYQSYMKCQMRQPPLENQWGLQVVSVPSGGLALSLHSSSGLNSRTPISHRLVNPKGEEEGEKLICCGDCTSNYVREAAIIKSQGLRASSLQNPNTKQGGDNEKSSTDLPFWLQQQFPLKIESPSNKDSAEKMVELRKTWNRLCQSIHPPLQTQIPNFSREAHYDKTSSIASSLMPFHGFYAMSSPWWSSSQAFNGRNNSNSWANNPSAGCLSLTDIHCNSSSLAPWKTQQFWSIENNGNHHQEPANKPKDLSFQSFKTGSNGEVRTTLSLGLDSSETTTKSGPATSVLERRRNLINPRDFCRDLQENLPWQMGVIPRVSEALLDENRVCCLLIRGSDRVGKRRLARTVAQCFYGSAEKVVAIKMGEVGTPHPQILTLTLLSNPQRVILMEDINQADPSFLRKLAMAVEKNKLVDPMGRELSLSETIFIMTIHSSSSGSGVFEREQEVDMIQMKLKVERESSTKLEVERGSSPKHVKRKAELDLQGSESSNEDHPWKQSKTNRKKLSDQRPSSHETCNNSSLDLNLSIEDGEPHSDLTQETIGEYTEETQEKNTQKFLDSISKSFVFDPPSNSNTVTESLSLKLRSSFREVFGERGSLMVEQGLLEKMMSASSSFLNCFFDKWVRKVFRNSLESIGERVAEEKDFRVRMCMKEEGLARSTMDCGFEGSNLPNRIDLVM
ncbi:hypothetical protein AMTRI_Chr12g241860 [Amborella trichopoda]|uniref:Clp R domain-containing protein n=1 Tax=Amborella trichopoda TaxID=13333 RepID=W1PC07_AMBTC|nr:protein SMAX1-LIKE 4 [Amborella trichopoda]ERN07457.1 hypothetical protein AMTR_s00019p00252890 [Amborella trichopoda]|eukprot:XP_006845782.1 protein SMAX1-LIKE 4 [Amborella trichopoda]